MNAPHIKFNKQDKPEFYKVLQRRVKAHFKDNNISKHANLNMKLKTVFMICLYMIPFACILFGGLTNSWTILLMWIIMGLGIAGIGLCVMHDANHGSYSSNKTVNTVLGAILNLVGGYHVNWKIQHNVLHHSFTNIHGYDEDIEKGIIRLSPNQKPRSIYRFQIIYAPLLYCLMTIYWLIGKDFEQLLRYNKKDLLEAQGITLMEGLFYITIAKIAYIIATIVLPIMILPQVWWQTILGFLLMHFIAGLILSLIFQPAHVIQETGFYRPSKESSVENSWAIHQLHTTANFANESRLFSWLVGGLNFQVEHHLFPHICHVHYKDLSKIVKQTAAEFDIPYLHHKTYYGAVKSHFSMLYELGNGAYDRKMAKAS